jgi:hypothetical protein
LCVVNSRWRSGGGNSGTPSFREVARVGTRPTTFSGFAAIGCRRGLSGRGRHYSAAVSQVAAFLAVAVSQVATHALSRIVQSHISLIRHIHYNANNWHVAYHAYNRDFRNNPTKRYKLFPWLWLRDFNGFS